MSDQSDFCFAQVEVARVSILVLLHFLQIKPVSALI